MLAKREQYVEAVCKELLERRDYLGGDDIDTIYFGGGTPSQLSVEHVSKILGCIYNIYNVRANAELTLEGNPDDLTLEYLLALQKIGINRLSTGIQSFDDNRLRFIRRRHTAFQALDAVSNAHKAGISNVSIDLMFGFPGQTLDEWKNDVNKALSLPIKHLSAYSLMYDEGTVLADLLDKGDVVEIDDDLSLQMYQYLVDSLKKAGFEHYEISNFCRPGYASRHNSGYWSGVKYLGVGAAAHSFDGVSRQYNVESLDDYLSGSKPLREILTKDEMYNEYVFTSLRTCAGLNVQRLKDIFGQTYYDYCLRNAEKHIADCRLECVKYPELILRLSSTGIYVSNDIMSDLMMV